MDRLSPGISLCSTDSFDLLAGVSRVSLICVNLHQKHPNDRPGCVYVGFHHLMHRIAFPIGIKYGRKGCEQCIKAVLDAL